MRRQRIDDYLGPYSIGVDVSAYQGSDIDWGRVARADAMFEGRSVGPVRFAVVRSSDGVQTRRNSEPDPMAVRNLQNAHAAGLLVAVYHYVRAFHGAREQAEIVLDVIRTAGVPIGFVALDVEGRPDDPKTPDTDESHGAWWHEEGEPTVPTSEVLADLIVMKRHFQARSLRSLIYTGAAWQWHIAQKGLPIPPELETLDLWTPYYTKGTRPKMPVGPRGEPHPWPEWRIWQFAGSKTLPGRVPGISGNVDLNRFRGDAEELREWWSPETLPPPPPDFARDEIQELAERALVFGDLDAAVELRAALERLERGC